MIALISIEQAVALSVTLTLACLAIHLLRPAPANTAPPLPWIQRANPLLGAAIFALMLPSLIKDAEASSSQGLKTLVQMLFLGGWLMTLWTGTMILRLAAARFSKKP